MKTILAMAVLSVTPVSPLWAQVISGRVLLPGGADPASNVVITAALASGGATVRTLSSSSGLFQLHVPVVGEYEIRALRVGFRPTVVRLDVPSTGVRDHQIVLESLPIELAGMNTKEGRDCELKGRDAQTFLAIWEQAKGALASTAIGERSGDLDIEMIRMDGHVDPRRYAWPRPDSLSKQLDTTSAQELSVRRVFGSTPPETLATSGYVRSRLDGRSVFDLPNAETMLSDQFVATHCFRIRRDDKQGLIGLMFEPRRRVQNLVDVEGVLWLDRSTAELRRLEFAYRNLPDAEYQLCDSHPFIVITPEMLEEQPVFKQPAPYCMTLKDGQSNRLGLGGSADFVRLPTGQWLIARWELLTPPDTAVYRKGNRTKIVRGKIERCYSGADCHTVVALVPRLTVSAGVVTRVIREGVTLYSDPVRENLLRSMNRRYSGGTGAFSGVITDEAGRPLTNATIQNESPWRVARSDSFGRFTLDPAPSAGISLSVRCRGYLARRIEVQAGTGQNQVVAIPLAKSSTVPEPEHSCSQKP